MKLYTKKNHDRVKAKIAEESVIFISILKWFVLSTAIGVIVGVATAFFLKILEWATLQTHVSPYYFLFLPIAFFLSALMIKYLAPGAEGHGTEKVIEAVHKQSGKINPMVVPIKLITTVITLAFGGSAGKEGPCAQIGAGLASIFASLFRFDDLDRKKLVICGISAGFASVFGTPIAGAIFGVEVLMVGNVLYEVLFPCFIAGVTSYQVSSAIGITYYYHPMHLIPVFKELFFIKVALAGIFFGIVSFVLIELLKLGKKLSDRLKIWPPFKGILGGLLLAGLALAISDRYLGLGLSSIEDTLQGLNMVWYAFILKIIFTSITLNFGGSGGIVTPIFFIGVTAGNLFAQIWGLDIATFSAIGMVALLAGAANTPIAASIMAVELFGPQIAPYAAVACVISFLMTGHRSVYPSQILSVTKSPSFELEIGDDIDSTHVHFKPRKKSLIGAFLLAFESLKSRKNRKMREH
ncbi:MAG: chloride channel protein [Deltaproteobacteria bacterium]|nr:chloride channel protein [Deltaproteobacteria bacterium]